MSLRGTGGPLDCRPLEAYICWRSHMASEVNKAVRRNRRKLGCGVSLGRRKSQHGRFLQRGGLKKWRSDCPRGCSYASGTYCTQGQES
jgi:hypothetical protein